MPDFTSSLYLGMTHSSGELPGWSLLTTGVPAALSEPWANKNLGYYLAQMQGCETGIIAPSTLHIYFDLIHLLSRQKITVYIDEYIYRTSTYSIEKLAVKNIPIHRFKHMDAHHLYALIKNSLQPDTIPIVFTDGFCPQCGKPAPVKEYSRIVEPYYGKIIIDDTQAFGVLGKRKNNFVYGYGGGGILQWLGIANKNIVTVVSLAKAFGVPMAVISGSKNFISAFEQESITRESASPVSSAHVMVAYQALIQNGKSGDKKRKKLFQNVSFLRRELIDSGIWLKGGLFPVQSLAGVNNRETVTLFNILKEKGLQTVLITHHSEKSPVLCFIINSTHTVKEIQLLAGSIKRYVQ